MRTYVFERMNRSSGWTLRTSYPQALEGAKERIGRLYSQCDPDTCPRKCLLIEVSDSGHPAGRAQEYEVVPATVKLEAMP